MKVTMMLADAAQAVGGKLYILGGGWSITGPAPTPSAVALMIQTPWDRANEKHHFRLELVDSDGTAVTDEDAMPILVHGEFEPGRPPGIKPGSWLETTMAINVPPLQLEPDTQFEWRLTVGEESREDWRLPFTTRPAQAMPG
jgi:hypothetical protein